MRIAYTFRNVESSDAFKDYAGEKIGRLQKYLRAPLDAEVTLSAERHLRRVHVILTADGGRYEGHEDSETAYAAVDLVLDKLDRQVRTAKDASTTNRRQTASGTIKAP
ncbi:MAG: ribosome-associated translation inhibitor RaiA [Polyangiales bacterium]